MFCFLQVACAGEASHLTGYTLSKHDNVVDKSVELGQKTIVSKSCPHSPHTHARMSDMCDMSECLRFSWWSMVSRLPAFLSLDLATRCDEQVMIHPQPQLLRQ